MVRIRQYNAAPFGSNPEIGGIAIGDTVVSKSQSVAIGSGATSNGKMNVVIGNQVKSMGEQDVVIGNGAVSNRENPDSYNIAIGRAANATADASGAIAMGYEAKAGAGFASAIGRGATATGTESQAWGVSANATKQGAIAIGRKSTADGLYSIAMGADLPGGGNTTSAAQSAIAIGNGAQITNASANSAIAIGQAAKSDYNSAIALGLYANATGGNYAMALGGLSTANGTASIAAGLRASANAERAIAIGREAHANASSSSAMGAGATATSAATNGIAYGTSAGVAAENAVAIGATAFANNAGAVALGSASTTRAATAENTATVGGVTYSGFAGNAPASVVSVGSAGAERQLVNVAAGKISATSTDAINGSQLYAVAKQAAAPLTFTANTNADTDAETLDKTYAAGDGTQQQLGETISIIGAATGTTLTRNTDAVVSGDYSAKNIQTVVSNGEVQIQMAENPIFDSVQFGDTTGPKITNDGNNIKVGDSTGGATKITNVANGTNANDAVNLSQLNATKVAVLAGDNTAVTPTPNATTGGTDYTVHADKTVVEAATGSNVTVTPTTTTNANGTETTTYSLDLDQATKAQIAKEESVSTGTPALVTVTTNATKNATGGNDYVVNVTKGTFEATPTTGTDAGKLVAPTTDGVATVSDVVNAINASGFNVKSGGNKAAGDEADATLINPGEEVTFTAGKNLTVKRVGNEFTYATADDVEFNNVTANNLTVGPVTINNDGINAGNTKITNVANGTNGTDAVNLDQLNASTAANAWKITGNNDDANATTVGNQTVSFNNGTGTTAVVDGTNVTYNINTDGTTVKVGTDGNLTVVTGDLSTTDGKVALPTGDAGTSLVNQTTVMNAINQSGWKLAANGTAGTELINPSETVTFIAGTNLEVVRDGANITYKTADNVSFNNVTANNLTVGPVTITNGGINAGNTTITNVKAGTNGTDAVNLSQLNASTAAAKTEVTSNDKTVTVNTTTGAAGQTIYDLSVKTDGKTIQSNATTGALEVVTGNTTVKTDGSIDIAAGSNATDVATIGDITSTINKGFWTTKVNGANVDQVNFGDSVNFVNGTGTVARADGANITFDVKTDNSTIIVDSNGSLAVNVSNLPKTVLENGTNTVVTGDGSATNPYKVNVAGDLTNITSISNGNTTISLGDNEVNIGGATITNVANGTNATDAVNLSQLNEVKNIANAAKTEVVAGTNVNVTSTTGTAGQTIYTVNAEKSTVTAANGSPITVVSTTNTTTGVTDYQLDVAVDGDTIKVENGKLVSAANKVRETVVAGSSNVVVTDDKTNATGGKEFTVDLAQDVTVNSVTTNTVNVGPVTVTGNTAEDGVNELSIGNATSPSRITNVAPGVKGTDAVNVNQLQGAVTNINNRINDLEDDMEGGMAGARAVAVLPQVHRPGSSMLAVGLGSYGDKGAVAVGFSSLSDNGRLTFKANVDANTENKFGAGVGMGWEW